jgi:hypothetical protein
MTEMIGMPAFVRSLTAAVKRGFRFERSRDFSEKSAEAGGALNHGNGPQVPFAL